MTVHALDWPLRPLPGVSGSRLPQYQAIVRRVALDAIHGHGKSITSAEVCGVLVGNVYRDEHGPYLYVAGAIRGDRASGLAAQVTFTAETWAEIQEVMDREHPDERIVGWYHTHPGFGVFLSGMDLFIQDHFFNLPWQVALVYDPISGDEGMFFWKQGKADRQAFLIEEEDRRAHAPTLAEMEAEHLSPKKAAAPFVERRAVPQEALHAHAVENQWSSGHTRTGPVVPIWLIGLIAFAISFGCTLWAMFASNEVVTVPHHIDHSESSQSSPAQDSPVQGDK
jgi:proteasome lid subunit RPN8/RPN11